MNIQALITMLVLGSSSVAMARPAAVPGTAGTTVTSVSSGTTIIRDHRAPMPAPAYDASFRSPPPFAPLWTTLGVESRILDGAMAFRVSPSMGRFTTLKLQRTAGKSLINSVRIQFANGRTQTVELNQYLDASKPWIVIDLAGDSARAIRSVTVVGRNARQSSFSVLAH